MIISNIVKNILDIYDKTKLIKIQGHVTTSCDSCNKMMLLELLNIPLSIANGGIATTVRVYLLVCCMSLISIYYFSKKKN